MRVRSRYLDGVSKERVLRKVWRQRRVVSEGRGIFCGKSVRWMVSGVPGIG